MASPHRQTDHSLNEKLKELSEHPYRFRFYQAMRLLEAAYSKEPKFGESLKLSDNTMRLGQEPSLAFAPSTIAKFGNTKGGQPKMDVLFFGVFGANGPLPHHLTEYVRDRVRNHNDYTIARFVDIFHHRALALFYRAWANSEPAVSLDRPEEDRFDLYLGAIGGQGLDGLKERDGVPDYAKRYYAGILGNATKNAEGLENMVSHFFGVPAKVAQFVGQWMDIPEDSWCRLGGSPETCALGTTATLGQKTWDLSQKFRLVIGPLSFKDFKRLLPDGESVQRLKAIVKNYVGIRYVWDVNLILQKDEIPPLHLGHEGMNLGWTTFLQGGKVPKDASDLVVSLVSPSDS